MELVGAMAKKDTFHTLDGNKHYSSDTHHFENVVEKSLATTDTYGGGSTHVEKEANCAHVLCSVKRGHTAARTNHLSRFDAIHLM